MRYQNTPQNGIGQRPYGLYLMVFESLEGLLGCAGELESPVFGGSETQGLASWASGLSKISSSSLCGRKAM